ncbi:thiopurine S-methyltransferase [Shewanella pealeana]|uniref:Thiopurine S-methyltransferase n=1 Tax=Shewanella pealeana (strain ATCC 700345 / ANG-SQ1) TaxID=398579 RepID=TPMT_SHEPA|nr:thiopurine S-methyltransferase [Shewanella pealeana]A8H029.1 RecName: Full=Thiopurine S-methyltransferase; AltName: Full=Thiopurine methyltransferase [Shewanella pealeana ATCC 700345]ABV85916.1 Thiopurine S-methyltransferase [Shewanella pealeana ATCC 700345]
MQPSFWHDKWDAQQVGFHLSAVNPLLVKYWPQLELDANAQVFVPLCGKSLDMCFLAEQGHEVLGCELNELAVQQFYRENELAFDISTLAEHQRFHTEQVTIYQGDIFSLDAAEMPNTQAFYDRAALIAWPEEMRSAYARQLAKLVPANSTGLLITLDYPQAELNGPPFAVSDDWVQANLATDFEIERLSSEDVLSENPRFVNKQVSWLTESVYKLIRKG